MNSEPEFGERLSPRRIPCADNGNARGALASRAFRISRFVEDQLT